MSISRLNKNDWICQNDIKITVAHDHPVACAKKEEVGIGIFKFIDP